MARAFRSNSYSRRIAISTASRKRRDSIRALPKIHQTRLLDTVLTPVLVSSAFPTGATGKPVTFSLDYAVTGASPSGIILNCGDSDPALTVYYDIGYVCTAGGAMVRFLSGKKLPLIEAMEKAYERDSTQETS